MRQLYPVAFNLARDSGDAEDIAPSIPAAGETTRPGDAQERAVSDRIRNAAVTCIAPKMMSQTPRTTASVTSEIAG